MPFPFVKMHGLGNDFVVIDARGDVFKFTPAQIRKISDRHHGVGCDQLIVLEKPRDAKADLYMAIYNPDGSRAEACGNATRCVAKLIGKEQLIIQTEAGLLEAVRAGDLISVDMGVPRFGWKDIPLSEERDTLQFDLGMRGTPPVTAVNMGNPHAVLFIQEMDDMAAPALGPEIEHHPLFPQKTNVEFAEVINRKTIRMSVWERSAGVTLACGSGACATLVAAVRRGFTERKAEVILDGGTLTIEWRDDNHVIMTGAAALSFHGTLSDELLQGDS